MYSVVMATMLTAGTAAPGHWFHGCHGCWGCWGGYASYSCYGCSGCWGSYYQPAWYGCYGSTAYYAGWSSPTYYYPTYYYQPVVSRPVVYTYRPVTYSTPVIYTTVAAPASQAVVYSEARDPPPIATEVRASAPGARITVRLPGGTRLYVDNVPFPWTSGERSFDTPPLRPGQDYFYTFRAEVIRDGQVQSESRRVQFAAGQQVNVDFATLAAAER